MANHLYYVRPFEHEGKSYIQVTFPNIEGKRTTILFSGTADIPALESLLAHILEYHKVLKAV